jgi:hypothetical protein
VARNVPTWGIFGCYELTALPELSKSDTMSPVARSVAKLCLLSSTMSCPFEHSTTMPCSLERSNDGIPRPCCLAASTPTRRLPRRGLDGLFDGGDNCLAIVVKPFVRPEEIARMIAAAAAKASLTSV